jgi:protein TonB
MILLIDRLNNERHKLSGLGSLLLVFVVFSMAQSLQRPAELVAREAIELTTTLIEPLIKQKQAIPPEPKAVAQPKTATPSVAPAPSEPIKDRSPVDAVKPAPAPAAPAAPAPLPPAPPQALPPPPSLPAASVVQAQEAPKPSPPQAPASLSLENNYIASIRATLNSNKRYPTGREASLQRPSGKVKLWFVLNRNGLLQEAGIDESSNSIILDNAALATVRRTSYLAWPEGSWPTQSQHKFTVTLDFFPLN